MFNDMEKNNAGTAVSLDMVVRSLKASADIPEKKRKSIHKIIKLKKNDVITDRDCRYRIFIELADLPLEVLSRVLKGN